MNKQKIIAISLIILSLIFSCSFDNKSQSVKENSLIEKIPDGELIMESVKDIPLSGAFERVALVEKSFASFLRNFPLKTKNNTVFLYNGQPKRNQDVHYAILKLDVGDEDLQQCADAVIRLRAEYLYKYKRYREIHFNFTNGSRVDFDKYAKGYRPYFKGNKDYWTKKAGEDYSYKTFRKYLKLIFNYAGTYSLSQELKKVDNINEIRAGDAFIQGGFPGHAIIVMDIAKHKVSGEKIFLLAQSYMPAQEMHILKNYNDKKLNPWYSTDFVENLLTPEWNFKKNDLKRFSM